MNRREMLRQAGLVTVGLAVTPVAGWPESWFRVAEVVVPFTDVPADFTGVRPGEEAVPGQNRFAQDLRNLRERITPIEDFFAVGHYNFPQLEAASYRLEISGLVDAPRTYTLEELGRLPRVERTFVFECSGNSRGLMHGMVGNARWLGVELREILDDARITAGAREVHFWGADTGTEEIRGAEYDQNFARSMSLDQIAERNPILAYEMNGQPIPAAHGFPVRLIVPGWYGIGQVKWLQRIDVSPDRLMNRFMARDYVTVMGHEQDDGIEWVETSVTRQRVKSVIARVTRDGDQFTIFGAAWSDGTPLEKVEVRVDEGSWQAAELQQPQDPHEWTFFTLRTRGLADGEHTLVSRATDYRGRTQPENLDLKKTRWENNELFYRTIQVAT